MDFTPGIATVRTHWKLIGTVALLAAVIAYAVSFLFSPSYSASSKILVRAREARFLTSTGQDLSRQLIPDSTLAKSLGQTNDGLVKSRALAEDVVNTLKLDGRPADTSLPGAIHRCGAATPPGARAPADRAQPRHRGDDLSRCGPDV